MLKEKEMRRFNVLSQIMTAGIGEEGNPLFVRSDGGCQKNKNFETAFFIS